MEQEDFILGPPLEPAPMAMNYLEPGWIILYVLAIIIGAIILFLVFKKYRRNAYGRYAINELGKIQLNNQTDLNYIFSILKSTAIKSYGRKEMAALSGAALFNHLNKKYHAFDDKLCQRMTRALYSRAEETGSEDNEHFISQIQTWIRKHGV